MNPVIPDVPLSAAWDAEREVVCLAFAEGRSGAYAPRGGIAWPAEIGGRIEGALVGGGLDAGKGVFLCFVEQVFSTVGPLWDPDQPGVLRDPGAVDGIRKAAGLFRVGRWFHAEAESPHARHVAQLRRALPELHPSFPRVGWSALEEARGILRAWVQADRVRFVAGGPTHQALQALWAAAPGAPMPPAARALAAALYGLEVRPWRGAP